jgi:RNA polymerase sigma-70 factor (ECF subfamily)
MTTETDTDEALMAAVAAAGDRAALERLVRRHAGPLLGFVCRMLRGDGHRAEEIVQDALLAVWVKRALYQSGRPFKPWLYAIAVNGCRSEFRSRRWDFDDLPETDPPAPDGDPTAGLPAGETSALVSAALDRLPPQQRAVVMMRIWEDLPYSEIARVLDRSEGTVRSHMHHGLAALREWLGPRME